MLRTLALLVGLGLMAGTVEAQAPTVTQARSQRTISSTKTTVGDTTILTYVSQDSFRTRVVSRFKPADSALIASLQAQVKTLQDSITKLLGSAPPPPPPPADTTPTPPPPPPADTTPPTGSTKLFSSDWSGGLLDGGKWTRWGGQGSLAAVSATGLGFPTGMVSVLRVAMGTGDFDWVQANAKWTLPAVGESRAFRVYLRNAVGNVSGGWSATHPVESKGTDGSINGNYYALHLGSNTDGTGAFLFATPAGYPRNNYTPASRAGITETNPGTLNKNTTYRVEWKWTRTGTSTYSLDLRISNPDGSLAYDNATIKALGGGYATLASNNTGFTVDPAFMTGIRFGINGGFSASGTQYVYWGGFAVCTDWCGA